MALEFLVLQGLKQGISRPDCSIDNSLKTADLNLCIMIIFVYQPPYFTTPMANISSQSKKSEIFI